MRILYPPGWLNHYHWLIFGTLLVGLSAYCWILYKERKHALTLSYAIAWTSLAGICIAFWLIQTEVTGIDPVWLFVVERAFWAPLGVAAFFIVDMHAADFNGHRSLITKFSRYMARRRSTYANHSE